MIINKTKNLDLDKLNKNIEKSVANFSESVKELKNYFSEINENYTLYSKQKMHESFFNKLDKFLNIIDN